MGLLLIACGGAATPKAEAPESTPPASKADDAASSSGDADSKGTDSKSSGDSAGSSDTKSDDASGSGKGGASTDELKTVMQLTIEDPELDKYLHLEEPGRFPLKMAGKDLPSGLGLTKAGQPVKIVDGEPAKKDAVLVITKIEVTGSDAAIGYRFDIEGIVGTAHLKKASYGWELASSRIVEHYRPDDAKDTKKKK
ncbi:MAG TPA: hypothetical protein VH062_10545 [Polyangiaceae bacterium]|nr:hypothetical protein [Polyangiaceae bacterium]